MGIFRSLAMGLKSLLNPKARNAEIEVVGTEPRREKQCFLVLGGSAREFLFSDVAAIDGAEMEGGPITVRLGKLEALIEMIVALGRADEKGATAAVRESGSKDFGPDLGMHRSELVEHDEIQTAAAEAIVLVGTAKRDGAAGRT